ncbi:LOW QUALITY PROTEIN: sulfate permease [Vibrio sp. JCM 18904]|nr:LOW QUALITY PROTEIN: sulfate permease [Vibrio sp. JCM 18904]
MNQENHSQEASVETQQTPKFSVGIDLGTTHCVMSFVDTHNEDARVEVMPIPQLTAPGTVETRSQLGSFLYQPHEHEMNPQSRVLPWSSEPKALVGAIARNLGSKTPIRLVASAKSWLCHAGVNRRDAFLPAGSPEEVEKVSPPLRATELYLEHLKDAWNHTNPNHNLADQDVTITVPASFDPAARDLTAEAARNVGFVHLTLLEEPQAALYNWIDNSNDKWRDEVEVGDIVLVVDIGGGTTDLSLVEVTEDDGNLTLNRIAVGEHILLGGDNMDLALAYRLKMKLAQEGKELQPWQVQAMTHACRDAKEALLNDSELQSVPIVVPSRGSNCLAATLKTELTQEEVQQTLVDGFFPQVAITDHPVQRSRGALTQMGLPYAQDAGITRHIAAFLSKQTNALSASGYGGEAAQDFNPFANMPGMPGADAAQSVDFIKPTAILFNGGVLKSKLLATRLEDTINEWLIEADAEMAKRLTGVDLDLAVASGAAYYGSVRRGQGVRIRGGIASAYYVGIESAMPAIPGMAPPMEALCVAPFGMEEGSSVDVPSQEFGLIIGQPVNFQFFGSTVRRDDLAGTHLDYWAPEELEELPEIQVTLPVSEGRREGEVVPVTLASRVTELGTLYLEAIAADNGQKWHVEFDVREDAKSNSNEEE